MKIRGFTRKFSSEANWLNKIENMLNKMDHNILDCRDLFGVWVSLGEKKIKVKKNLLYQQEKKIIKDKRTLSLWVANWDFLSPLLKKIKMHDGTSIIFVKDIFFSFPFVPLCANLLNRGARHLQKYIHTFKRVSLFVVSY